MNDHGSTIVFKSTGISLQAYILKEEYTKNTVGMKWEGKASNCFLLHKSYNQNK